MQRATVIDFAAVKKNYDYKESGGDVLALCVIVNQALMRAAVFFRRPVSKVMNVVDFHDLQRGEKTEKIVILKDSGNDGASRRESSLGKS